MRLVDYDFDLPEALIAQRPTPERDQARLLILNRADGSLQHLRFGAIVDQLAPGDALVLNQTQVVPARLKGRKVTTGGRVELLLLRPLTAGDWLAMGRPGRGFKTKDAVGVWRWSGGSAHRRAGCAGAVPRALCR